MNTQLGHQKKADLVDSSSAEISASEVEFSGLTAKQSVLHSFLVGSKVIFGNIRFWLLMALIGGLGSQLPYVGLLFWPFTTVLVVGATHDLLLGEREISVTGAWMRWSRRIIPTLYSTLLALVMFIIGLASLSIVGVPVYLLFDSSLGGGSPITILLGLALLGWLLGVIVLFTRLTTFVFQVAVIEEKGGPSTVWRSSELVDESTWSVIFVGGILATMMVTFQVLVATPAAVIGMKLASKLVGALGLSAFAGNFFILAGGAPSRVLTQAILNWQTAVWTCLYHRQCLKNDERKFLLQGP